jgi:hypothetical protein
MENALCKTDYVEKIGSEMPDIIVAEPADDNREARKFFRPVNLLYSACRLQKPIP